MRHTRLGMIAGLAAVASLAAVPVAPVAESRDREPREPDPEPDTPVAEPGPKVIPDHVSLEPASEHYFADWRKIGVRHNGMECSTVFEFCVSEGWARFLVFHGGRPKQERGRFIGTKRFGTVEAYWR